MPLPRLAELCSYQTDLYSESAYFIENVKVKYARNRIATRVKDAVGPAVHSSSLLERGGGGSDRHLQ